MDRDVRQAGFLQLRREVARELDAVRHERRLEAEARGLADDRDELVALAERGVASRDLDAHPVAVRLRAARRSRSITSAIGMSFTFSDDSER